ncbi:Bug family tripartite tricarboxylate transporter substrate binding protein [Haladaptatus sp. CMSO5]|uniref:Bug family tripartite tricarboxylate transporter substrate binding protein n=1 Tax=Haladaptatus sp. CMSO5 TaxID=3120514 RepID=UPI002FCE3593
MRDETKPRSSGYNRRTFLKATGAVGATMAIAGCTGGGGGDGEEYPSSEVTMVVPFGAGGGTDTQYRGIKQYFEDELGVQTVVDNRPGASGRQGMNYMYQQDADGYTLGCISVPTGVLGAAIYDTQYKMSDITTIGIPSAQYFAWVSESGRFESLEAFVDFLQNSDSVKVGTVGQGSSNHFGALATLDAMNVDVANTVESVPYDSGAEVGTAVARGDVDFGTAGETGVTGLVEDGRLDVMFIDRPEASPLFPDAPTVSEMSEATGSDIPVIALQLGVFGPPGIEDAKVSKLEEALTAAAQTDEYKSWAEDQGLSVVGAGSQELRDQIDQLEEAAQRYKELTQ